MPDDHIASAPHGQNPVNLPDHGDGSRLDAERAGGPPRNTARRPRLREASGTVQAIGGGSAEVRDQHRAELEAVREAQERLRKPGRGADSQ